MKKIYMFFVVFFLSQSYCYPFGDKWTHPSLTEKAIIESNIEQYLIQELGIDEGLQKKLFLVKWGTGTY